MSTSTGRSGAPYGDEPGPLALAHRGGAGLAPENTYAAFALAAALGVRYLETDVRLTADGRLLCLHDARLDRTTDGRGRARDRTLEEVRRLRVTGGGLVPTLDEVLDAFPGSRIAVDVKDRAAVGPLVEAVARAGAAERVCVAGAWDGWLAQVRADLPGVRTALGWRALAALVTAARTGVRPHRTVATGEFAHVPWALVRRPAVLTRLVGMADGLGVRVAVWTVDDAPTMRHLLDAGVGAVVTDRPDVLREVLLSRGEWVVPAPGPARPRVRRAAAGG
ncbi:glycerophosphodiester phosphodiesterase family protein [Lapillicoccus jejuensis]|uniref:Glycerophosphoryl diester phosphodiesterase n=1 Tax=Lapillicoccus jejuensis TaxID=402171 RepID=A0A542E0A6_9MICO|nr:glycerophosphodiester phosphodiesterase family protein [Lapillicoccus jejuensis]TQJ08778.1 glycerophosphoryl diester phosphodiesterase [Lapillicoccus jejuensis]